MDCEKIISFLLFFLELGIDNIEYKLCTIDILYRIGVYLLDNQNKKESVAALHRENIQKAAEKLFLEKGVSSTTIDDISKESEYSRRTIYTYYKSKDDILYHIVMKGLFCLNKDLIEALNQHAGFFEQYHAICGAMEKYQINCPQSFVSVKQMKTGDMDFNALPPVIIKIFELGTEINNLLAGFIEQGKKQGIVRADIEPMKTVYVMWGSITSLISLVQNKGEFLEKEFSASKESFLDYGYKQIINSILLERI